MRLDPRADRSLDRLRVASADLVDREAVLTRREEVDRGSNGSGLLVEVRVDVPAGPAELEEAPGLHRGPMIRPGRPRRLA